jgi:hypothetical protein
LLVAISDILIITMNLGLETHWHITNHFRNDLMV